MQSFRTPAFTAGNQVDALIDGEAYMAHLSDRLTAMKQGDYYHFTAWRVTPTQRLNPAGRNPVDYLDQVRALIPAGVAVRAMLWHVPFSFLNATGVASGHARENIDFVRAILEAGGQAILDGRVPHVLSCHHQKTAVLSSCGTQWAYVGGVDIAPDRWDTPTHNNPSPPRSHKLFEAWHDVHCAVRGAAVAQVWENFRQRWNDTTTPHSSPGVPGGATPLPIMDPPPVVDSPGTHNVQVLRTLPCRGVHSFLRAGEQTIRMAYERAIDLAEHYIYIEDQYAWPCTLVGPLNEAARRGVKVIFVLAHRYDTPLLQPNHNYLRHNGFLDRIRSGATDNVLAFHLQRPRNGDDIYVHAKVMIVDDCYAAIGSANIGHRSHTSDSELQIAVVDSDQVPGQMNGVPVTVCRFAKELRLSLWREHLALEPLDDPIAALASWPSTEKRTQVHHAVEHLSPPSYQRWGGLIRHAMNLRIRC
jgi:phosphatidylserine/phosphatidylglycerophosphate/cardiolipin synthase-like enzyme